MAKMTKAQCRKRLMECVRKLDNVVMKGSEHFNGAKRLELMKLSNKLLNDAHKLK